MRLRRAGRVLAVAVGISILVLSLVPMEIDYPQGLGWGDKIGNVLAYAVLGLLAAYSFGYRVGWLRAVLIALLCVLYGGFIEILQGFTGRDPELLDFAADVLGVILGSLVVALAPRKPAIKCPSHPSRSSSRPS